ncbi:MAG: GxxExxY protein [Verrucomicrobiales bacterium]|jgi:GxxExxY protein
MTENEIAQHVHDVSFDIHRRLGPGLLETSYEVTLYHKLKAIGLKAERQASVPITFDGIEFDEGFRADLIIENKVIIELKSVKALEPVHPKQLLTYFRLKDMRLGLLINFNEAL